MSESDRPLSQDILEAAVETAAGAIIVIDSTGIIRSANPATERIFGYPIDQLVGQNVSQLMPEPFRSRHDTYIQHHLTTGERRIIGTGREVMGRRRNGSIFPIHLAVSAFEADGQSYFSGIIHDLSHRSEDHSLQEQALFEAIFNHLPDAALIVDPKSRIMLCNATVARVFGYSPEDLIGTTTAHLYRDSDEHRRMQALEERLAAKDQTADPKIDVHFRRKSGEVFPAETVVSALSDRSGELIGFVLLNRDVSKQVVQDEALRKSQRMEVIGQLTGGIAHDFNNLLTIITGNHELLEMDLVDPGQKDLLKRANNAAMMGARLTNRLLTFARRRRLDPVVLDLNDQMLTMAELLRRTIGEVIALATLLAPGLWTVRADPSEIENAVLNLAINARDAMPSGGKLVIETSNVVLDAHDLAHEVGLEPGSYVRLSVSDTGVGMPPQTLARAFEPFFTTKEPGKGTGLGLSVIYGFVKQSGGHVTIQSQVDQGTTVSLYLPKVDGPAHVETEVPPASADLALPRTILLVEDNADVRSVTAQRLQHLGYTVLQAEDAVRAVAILERGDQIDLVVSDVVMPGGMSGFDLADWIAAEVPRVRILLTSGFAENVLGASTNRARDIEILRKPYTGAELSQAVRKAMEGDV